MKRIETFFRWLFSASDEEVQKSDPIDRLIDSLSLTARGRYNAAGRLGHCAVIAFGTNIIMSLGLILIPLIQLANIKPLYNQGIVNVALIFLAVTVLVYSLVAFAEKFDVRALRLTDCGNSIKDLIREIRALRTQPGFEIDIYNKKYRDIIKDSENHNRSDYLLAKLESRELFRITGLKYLWVSISSRVVYVPRIFASLVVIGIEALFIFKGFEFK